MPPKTAGKKVRRKEKKKKRKEAPLPRKGHVAVGAGDEERPLLVSHSVDCKRASILYS